MADNVLLERIRKLLTKTETCGATEAEARAALKMAEALMRESGITLEDIAQVEGGAAVAFTFTTADVNDVAYPPGHDDTLLYSAPQLDRWELELLSATAKMTNCKPYYHLKRQAHFVGVKSDPYIAIEIWQYLREACHKSALRWRRQQRMQGYNVKMNDVNFRSYKDGFCAGIKDQVAQTQTERLTAKQAVGNALVCVAQSDEAKTVVVKDYLNQHLLLGRGAKSRGRTFSETGYHAGRAAGTDTNLRRDVIK